MVLLVKVVDKSCVPPFRYRQLQKNHSKYITSVPIGKCQASATSTSRQSTPQPKSAMQRLQEINSDPQTSSSTQGNTGRYVSFQHWHCRLGLSCFTNHFLSPEFGEQTFFYYHCRGHTRYPQSLCRLPQAAVAVLSQKDWL